MSIDDRGVVARLQAGAEQVEDHEFDAGQVLSESRRALRRRRSWQAVAACTTAAAVTFSLALAGPVPVPGLGDVTMPGSEEIRELFGLEPEPALTSCEVDDDLSAEWSDASTRTVLVSAVGHVIDEGAVVRSSTFEGENLPSGGVSAPERLLRDIPNGIVHLFALRELHFAADVEDVNQRLADVDTQGLPDGTYIWWSATDQVSQSGVARCGGLPLTLDGEISAEFTITSWTGDDSSGVVDCADRPERPIRVVREALSNCSSLD